jgi:hypothetical protein
MNIQSYMTGAAPACSPCLMSDAASQCRTMIPLKTWIAPRQHDLQHLTKSQEACKTCINVRICYS